MSRSGSSRPSCASRRRWTAAVLRFRRWRSDVSRRAFPASGMDLLRDILPQSCRARAARPDAERAPDVQPLRAGESADERTARVASVRAIAPQFWAADTALGYAASFTKSVNSRFVGNPEIGPQLAMILRSQRRFAKLQSVVQVC